MKKHARKEIFKVKSYAPGRPIEEIKRKYGLKNVIKMASNENMLLPPESVLRAADKALRSVNRYPDSGCFYLKKALAQRLKLRPENIIVGNGSDEIIILLLKAFLKKDEEVIVAKPTFLIYEIASKIQGAKIKFAPLKDFRYDVKKILDLVSPKTKMIFIANPDNPSGTYINKKEVKYLISKAPKRVLLYFDEAYYEFGKSAHDFPETLRYLKNGNIVITRSFSKIYSLAGLRVGYGLSTPEIIDCLERVREPFNVNSVAQAAACAALKEKTHARKTLQLIEKGRAFLYKEFDSLGLKYVPSVTNFILIELGVSSKKIYDELLSRGIIVRHMGAWKMQNFIRVTIGSEKENKKFIDELKNILRLHSHRP